MNCSQCRVTQKVKAGMTCSACKKRVIALDPEEKPYLTDYAVNKVIYGLSGPDHLFFTYNQLYTQLHKIIEKKSRKKGFADLPAIGTAFLVVMLIPFLGVWALRAMRDGDIIFVVLVWSIIAFGGFALLLLMYKPPLSAAVLLLYAVYDALIKGEYLSLLAEVAIFGGLALYHFLRKPHVSDETIKDVIKKYTSVHPPDRLADGKAFTEMEPKQFDKEILKYSPERLLIVERDDLADMLLLNRFPLEQKTLVVSAYKYPKRAFEAFRHFVKINPEIPIAVMHDLSRDGLKMKERLLADPSWNLAGREIQDLGLFPQDVDKLKAPLWRPTTGAGRPIDSLKPRGTAEENVALGFRMPVDTAPPCAMMAMTALAVIAGAALLSEAFLAQQAAQAGTQSSAGDGGFG